MGYSYSFLNNVNIMFYVLFGQLLLSLLISYVIAPKLLKLKVSTQKKLSTILKALYMSNILFNNLNIGFSVGLHFSYIN